MEKDTLFTYNRLLDSTEQNSGNSSPGAPELLKQKNGGRVEGEQMGHTEAQSMPPPRPGGKKTL